jgi:hypothetical protein
MNVKRFLLPLTAIALCLGGGVSARAADDTVPVSKSRLEELERKEAELNKLKGEINKTKDENSELKKLHEEDKARIQATPKVVKHESPPINTMLPIAGGTVVDAMDLADHYQADAAAADQRYRKQTFKLQGEVAGFGNQLLQRPYRITLKTPDSSTRVICVVQPPDKYSAVHPAKEGSQLVGTSQRYEDEVIARLGDIVVVQGKCDGWRDSVVHMSGCVLVSAHPKPAPVENR